MSNYMPPQQQQQQAGPGMPAVGVQAAEVVPLPESVANAGEGATVGGFMSKFQVHFPATGNDNPARRITSVDHTDSQGWTWRLVLHPWGHDARGCYSAFLELVNADSLPAGFSRYVKLEFAMHAWDTAYHVEPNKTQFLLHKFNAQATDFGYTRAFEHDYIMAQRNIFIDPQGYVRISVKIIDVREAYFRVATDADLARSVTGRAGGGDFADWRACLPAKSFKHDQLLYVIQKVSELTGVPLVSCRPWLCMPRNAGAIRPVAALLPQHLQMTICDALGDRPQYHIYLEEVDSLPEVWDRRRAVPGDLPSKEAGELLLSGRAYAQLPNEVYLVFLKIDRRILAAALPNDGRHNGILQHHGTVGSEPEFVFIGKAMAHKSDRGCELVPIARNLANLPDTINLEVFEQLAPEEVRRFSGERTVQEACLSHGSVLLFRNAQEVPFPPHTVPPAASAVVPFKPAIAAAAKAAAISSTKAAALAPAPVKSAAAVAKGAALPATTPKPFAPKNVPPVGSAAAALPLPKKAPSSGVPAASPSLAAASAGAVPVPTPSLSSPRVGDPEPKVAQGQGSVEGAVGAPNGAANSNTSAGGQGNNSGENRAAVSANAVGSGNPAEAGTGSVSDVVAGPPEEVVMDAAAQRRATCLALYQVQENARQRQFQEVAKTVARQLVSKTSRFTPIAPRISGDTSGSAAPAELLKGTAEHVNAAAAAAGAAAAVTVAEAAAAAVAGTAHNPTPPTILTAAETATVAAAAKVAAAAAAAKHMVGRLAAVEAKNQGGRTTTSLADALREGAPTPATTAAGARQASNAVGSVPIIGWQSASPQKDSAVASDKQAVAALPTAATGADAAGDGEDTESEDGEADAERNVVSDNDDPAKKIGSTKNELLSEVDSAGVATTSAAAAALAAAGMSATTAAAAAASAAAGLAHPDPSGKDRNSNDENRSSPPLLQTTENEAQDESILKNGSADEGEEAGGPQTRETRAVRTSRVERTSAEEEGEAERPHTQKMPPTSDTESAPAAVAAAPVEQQRRSSRKAAAIASQQMRCSARAGSRGAATSVTADGSPAATAASTVLHPSRGGGISDNNRDVSGGAASGVGEEGGGGVKARASPEKSSVKRPAEDAEGGPRKSAKNADGDDKGEPEMLGSSDLPSLITQMINVPGFTADKCLQIARSKEMAEIANAIATIGNDEKDSFRSRQLERLLAIKEKEAQRGIP